jgi:hypothetical protein
MELKNYCLDLEKVNKITEKDTRDRINEYYQSMLNFKYIDGKNDLALNYFNTLLLGGYLIDIRDQKIEKILS